MAMTWAEIAAAKGKRETVHVPEIGGDVVVWHMSAKQRAEYDGFVLKHKDDPDVVGKAGIFSVAACLGDESGPFGRTAEEIGELPSAVVDRLATVAGRVNVLTREAVEDVEGN